MLRPSSTAGYGLFQGEPVHAVDEKKRAIVSK
jgi:hypothetical protein